MNNSRFEHWHLGGNIMVQGYVDSLGRSVVFYEANSIPDEPPLGIFPASDEEWTDPALWTPCPDVATAAIIAAVMEAHAARVAFLRDTAEPEGSRADEESACLMLDRLETVGWFAGLDEEYMDYIHDALPLEIADAAASFAIAHLTGIKRNWGAPEPFPLCQPCQDTIGGACAGPDAPWRPADDGEACGADNCCALPDPYDNCDWEREGGAR